jgi:hypothetical protein
VTTSMTLMAPTGGDGAAAGATRALNQDEVTNVTPDLLDAVLARDNLWRAWKRVKANRGAPGIDGVRLEDFPAYARNHWLDVREQGRTRAIRPAAGASGSHPEAGRGRTAAGHPDHPGPGHPASHRASADTDLRADLLGIELRLPTRPLGTPGDPAGTDRRQGRLSHRGRPGPGQAFQYGRS